MQGSIVLPSVLSFLNYFPRVIQHASFLSHCYVWITVSGTIPYGPAQPSDIQAQIPVNSMGVELEYFRVCLGPLSLQQTNML